MRRLLIIMLALGATAAAGGVGFLYYQGFNVDSMALWTKAIEGLVTQPAVLFGALQDPTQRGLIGGLLAGIFGASVLVVTMLLVCVGVLISSLRSALRSLIRKTQTRRDKKAENPATPKRDKSERKPRFSLPRLSLPRFGGGGFKDASADLEKSDKPGILSKLIDQIASLKKSASKPKTTQVTVGSGGARQVIAEISEDKTFHADLKAWHARVKGSTGADFSLIEEARDLRERMTRSVSEQVLESDPMGGEFLMRMVQAWAEKGATPVARPARPEPVNHDDESSLMEAAINDVMEHGISDEDGDEEDRVDLDEGEGFLPEHLFAGLDNDDEDEDESADLSSSDNAADLLGIDPTEDRSVDLDDEDEEEAPFVNPEIFSGGDDDEDDDEAAPSPAQDSGQSLVGSDDEEEDDGEMSEEEFEAHLKAIHELKSLAFEIDQGMAEWPEYLQGERARVATLERSILAVRDALETLPDDTLSGWFEENAGAPEWDWIDEKRSDLEAERQAILEAIAGSSDDDDEDQDGDDAGEVDDFSLTANAFSPRAVEAAPEENETPEEIEEASTETEEKTLPTQVESEPSETVREAEVETEQVETSSDEVEVVEQDGMRGQNVTLDQLVEVEMCDDLLTKWGYAARAAGASEAKLVSTVVAKSGVKRRVVGVAHMVAGWKDGSTRESRRMNLLFRYVPEGQWRLEVGGSIRMVDDRENFVEVSEDLLEHPDLKSQKTVIHFYGPGVPEGLEGEPLEDVFVVSRVLTSAQVTEKMES